MSRTRASSLVKEVRENWTETSQCGQEDFLRRWMDEKKAFRYWMVGYQSVSSLPDGGRHRKA